MSIKLKRLTKLEREDTTIQNAWIIRLIDHVNPELQPTRLLEWSAVCYRLPCAKISLHLPGMCALDITEKSTSSQKGCWAASLSYLACLAQTCSLSNSRAVFCPNFKVLLPVQIILCHPVILESICYRTTAIRLINVSNTTAIRLEKMNG